MNKSFITFTPTHFKVIVVIWTIIGLLISGTFVWLSISFIQEMIQENFKFARFPFFIIACLLTGVQFPMIFALYYYSRITLDGRLTKMLRWLFIISFPMLLYIWIAIYPSMEAINIFYEIVFILVHIIVFIKFPGYFDELRARKVSSTTSIDIIE